MNKLKTKRINKEGNDISKRDSSAVALVDGIILRYLVKIRIVKVGLGEGRVGVCVCVGVYDYTYNIIIIVSPYLCLFV